MGDSRRMNPAGISRECHDEISSPNNGNGNNHSAQKLLANSPPGPAAMNCKRFPRVNHQITSTPKCKMKIGCSTSAMSSSPSTSPNIPSPNSSITIVNSNSQNNSNTNTASTNASKCGKSSAVTTAAAAYHHHIHGYDPQSPYQMSPPPHLQFNGNGNGNGSSFYDNSNSIYTITPNKTPTITITNSSNCNSNSGNENQLMNGGDGNGSGGETSSAADVQEFLPVCDALFNVISLAIYFCDIVFDILTAYSFYASDGLPVWAIACFVFIASSVILSQLLSYRLYAINEKKRGHQLPCSSSMLLLTHFAGCGVLWRYFKLFIPLDMKLVKNKVRDLLLLRLVHGLVESAPMLFIQLYLILGKDSWSRVTDLNIVSTSFSLLSLCWALASFSKNIRQINVHKLMLTWLGLIFQFMWRLGTITSRILALTLYATVYHYWIFLVLVMHWLSMFAWIISPSFRIFSNEKMATAKKYCYSALLAIVYIFCYLNILESNSRVKMLIYYVTMILEDCLLLSVWYIAIRFDETTAPTRWYDEFKIMGLTIGSFCIGLVFMGLYYRFFHITKLNYGINTSNYEPTKIRGDETRSSSLMNGNFESSPTSFISNVHGHGGGGTKDKLTFESCSCNPPPPARNAASANINNNNNNKDNKFEFSDGVTVTNHASSNNACNNNGNNNSSFHGGPLHYAHANSKRPCTGMAGNGNGLGPGEMTVGGKKSKYSNGNVCNNINGFGNAPPTNNVQVQGVFNCRFNPAMKRKKKKPTSFVPPPNLGNTSETEIIAQQPKVVPVPAPPSAQAQAAFYNNTPGNRTPHGNKAANGGKMSHPFWKRPLNSQPETSPSQASADDLENIESVSVFKAPTTFDIQQKIYEKKQQQLADLRKIEQEIKQQAGALYLEPNYMHVSSTNSDHDHFNAHRHGRTSSRDEFSTYSAMVQPPSEKKRPWFAADSNSPSHSSPRPPNEDVLYDSRSRYLQDSFHPHENGLEEYENYCEQEEAEADWPQFDPSYNYDPYALDDDLPDQYHQENEVNHVQEVDLAPELEEEQQVRNISGARRRLLRRSAKAAAARASTSQSQSALDLVGSSTAAYQVHPSSAERGGGSSKKNGSKTSRNVHQSQSHPHQNLAPTTNGNGRQVLYKSCRRILAADIESQLSLSRSYTLPQEFKYRRKSSRGGLNAKNEQSATTLPSTNSSDGDVDSGEDETEIYGHLQKIPLPVPSVHHLHIPNQSRDSETPLPPAPNGSYSSPRKPEHETKL